MARRLSHLNPTYIFNRLRVMLDERRAPGNPWLTAQAVRILDELLRSTDVGVEFGSGRSTKWFANRLQALTSIESDVSWYGRVNLDLEASHLLGKVDYRLCEDLDDYAAQTKTFKDESIDFCLVDGEARDRCAMGMVSKIRPGGILVVDNANWYLPNDTTLSPDSLRGSETGSKVWSEFLKATADWRCIRTSNGVTDTTIWLRGS